jgi:hypothetical protein
LGCGGIKLNHHGHRASSATMTRTMAMKPAVSIVVMAHIASA